jgi:hypothetical protein
MKITSITTSRGAALFVEAIAPYSPLSLSEGWGLIVSGDRRIAMMVALSSPDAKWIADYSHKDKKASVVRAGEGVELGSEIEFDPSDAIATCPHCGSTEYNSKGRQWVCKKCGKSWVKGGANPRGGYREGSGKKPSTAPI